MLANYNSDNQLAQSLNAFFVRFDVYDFSDKHSEIRNRLLSAPPLNPFFDEKSAIKRFKGCKHKKSPGPDNIGGRLLRTCAEQLGPIFNYIFNLSPSRGCPLSGNSPPLCLLPRATIQKCLTTSDPSL